MEFATSRCRRVPAAGTCIRVTPSASIVLPAYNRLAFLREVVESGRAQTMPHWDMFVVDDGSIDGSLSWLDSLNDRPIVTIAHPHTGNGFRMRTPGLARASADWVTLLDSDDRGSAVKLERQLDYHRATLRARPGGPIAYRAATRLLWRLLAGHWSSRPGSSARASTCAACRARSFGRPSSRTRANSTPLASNQSLKSGSAISGRPPRTTARISLRRNPDSTPRGPEVSLMTTQSAR